MSTKSHLSVAVVSAIAIATFACPSIAQDSGNNPVGVQTESRSQPNRAGGTNASGSTRQEMGQSTVSGFLHEQSEQQWLTTDLVGQSIGGVDGRSIGKVQSLVIGQNGNVEAVVIGVGGFLGIGQKPVAVPFASVERSTTERGKINLVLMKTAEQLEEAPKFLTLKAKADAAQAAARREEAERERERRATPGATPSKPATQQ
jgi:sporulation protein YlmC with PRC-barrel domain